MSEKERMLNSLLYNADDAELDNERRAARQLLFEFNHLPPEQNAEAKAILKKLLGSTSGDEFCILAPFYCDYGYNIHLGKNFFANVGCTILDGGKVTFGDHVFIGPQVGFYTVGHPLDAERRNQGEEFTRPIDIGNNVWIGGHAVILPGVAIGDNTVIGAGSVVTKSIPADVIAAGNPCKVIRKISEADRAKYQR